MIEIWEEKKLNELGSVARGKSKHRPRNDPILYEGEFPFIQTGDVKNAVLHILNHSQTYNVEGLKQSKLWEKETLCITIAANIAETGILSYKACFPDSIVGFNSFPKKSDVYFVKYKIDGIKILYQNISKGTTQDNLSVDKLLSIKFKVPSYDTQVKIGHILSNYDLLIENNTRRIQILEEMAKLIYDEWFVKFKFPGHEKVKMVDSELGEIPEEWGVKKLEEWGKFKNGVNYLRDEAGDSEFSIVNVRNIANGKFLAIESLDKIRINYEKAKDYFLNQKDIIIARSACPGEVSLLIDGPKKVIFSGLSIRFRLENLKNFLYIFLSLQKLKENLENFSTGTALKSVNQETLKNIKILMPPKESLEAFRNLIEPIFDQISKLSLKNLSLSKTRNLLLPKLISGEIDVSELDIKVPEVEA